MEGQTTSPRARHAPVRLPRLPDLLLLAAAVVCAFNFFELVLNYGNLATTKHYLREGLPLLTRAGPGFHWSDLYAVIDSMSLDVRPRFLPVFFMLLDVKLRFWLLRYAVPHPTFSTVWIPTLGLGSWLLYRLLMRRTGDRRSALVGVILYLSSIGVLSGATDFTCHYKMLTIAIYIFALYSADQLASRARPGELFWQVRSPHRIVLPLILLAGLFTDETDAFLFVFLPMLYPSIFFKRGELKGLAALLAPVPVWLLLSYAAKKWIGISSPFFVDQYLSTPVGSGSAGASFTGMLGFYLSQFSFRALFDNLVNYFALPVVPGFLNPLVLDKDRYFLVPETSFLLYATVSSCAAYAVYLAHQAPARRGGVVVAVAAVAISYVLLTSLITFTHFQRTNGVYYGSAFSLFSAILGSLLYFEIAAGGRRKMATLASALALFACVAQAWNFRVLGELWNLAEISDTRVRFGEVNGPASFQILHPSRITRAELRSLREAWLTKTLDGYLRSNGISSAALYFLSELRVADRGP